MSQLNVDNITNRDGSSAPTFTKGAIVTGVATATSFTGDVTGDVTGNLTGTVQTASQPNITSVGNLTNLSAQDANISGVLTATTFKGDGSELSGIVGFATAVSQDVSHFASDFYTAAHSRQVPANTHYTVQGNAYAGNTVFTKLGQVHVAVGATFHIANGTNFVMDSLNIFE